MTNDTASPPSPDTTFTPKHPTAAATGLFCLWIALLSLPVWSGRFLAGQFSDQYDTGYAFRHWLATEMRRTGRIPLWNPELFGGLPFVGAMHGDIFYPTAWLRLILPTGTAMALGFIVHYVLAALFMYLLLRRLRVSWAGAVTGGLAYQLSGVIGTYVSPGHDGKLFVTALLPLALIGLVIGMRERRPHGYGIVALAVGLALLSPHAQMTYYLLIAAGIFALYLAFGDPVPDRPVSRRVGDLAAALGAVVVGFAIGMIQIVPFFEYLPFSPRAEGYYGFEGSTSFAIPWSHVPELFLANFVGNTPDGTYWGPNGGGLKLHSEYLGLPVLALAVAGAGDPRRRRLVVWMGGLGLLFLLISLGASTPFYRLWWAVMPFVKQTRAPGMALYVVALVVALLAGVGVERLQRGGDRPAGTVWAGIGAAVLALALVGVPGALAASLAEGVGAALGRSVMGAAEAGQPAIRTGAAVSGLALLVLGLAVLAFRKGRLPAAGLALAVPLIVSADLWRNAAPFWTWSPVPTEDLYAGDAVTERLSATPPPFRVLNIPGAYPGSSLMAYRIPQLLGYHGNELHAFDQLMGGKNQWRNLGNPKLWDLYAIRYVIVPAAGGVPDSLPGFSLVERAAPTAAGTEVAVFERPDVPYAWLAAAAIKVDDSTAAAGAGDPRLPKESVVLVPEDAAVEVQPLAELPPPLAQTAAVTAWEPGRMRIDLEPPSAAAFVVVAENWYPNWQATVDGAPAAVVRANLAQMAIPVPAGARQVELVYDSAAYRRGRAVSLLGLLLVVGLLIGPRMVRRRDG